MPQTAKPPETPKTQVRQMAKAAEEIQKGIAEIWRKDVIEKMAQSEVTSFTDARLSPEAAEKFERLAKAASKKIAAKYSPKRISSLTKTIASKVDNRNEVEMRKRVIEQTIGITPREARKAGAKSLTKEALSNLQSGVNNMAENSLKFYQENTLSTLRAGGGLEDVMKKFDGLVETRVGQAKQNARTQIAHFNSVVTTERAKALGIQEAKWITTMDGRERPSHADRNGKTFDLSKGLHSSLDGLDLVPGEDFNCRCDMIMVIPD